MHNGFRKYTAGSSFGAICLILIMGFMFNLNAAELPLVAVVTTGGTIAEKIDPETGAAVPALTGDDLVKSIPGIKDIARLQVFPLCNIDSSQMTPTIMLSLAQKVNDLANDPQFTGIIVTHGTDTMEETSYFLDLVLQTDKPVIFVGAQRNASDPAPDGPGNLANAVIQSVSPDARGLGVTVAMNQYACSARDVRKTHTDNVMTFKSMESGFIGYIDFGKFTLFRRPVKRAQIPLPKEDAALPDVMLFTMYAGADGKYVRKAVDEGIDGVVIAGFGLGNVNASVYEAVRYARSKNVPVVISSRCYDGRTYPLYGGPGGGKTLSDEKVIFSGGLIPSKARIMLLLGLTTTRDMERLNALFQN